MFIDGTLGFNRFFPEIQWDLILFHVVVREMLWGFLSVCLFFALQNIEKTLSYQCR